MSITQKAISARIKHEVLWAMDQEAMLGTYNRNDILNRGGQLFVDLLDVRRQLRCVQDIPTKRKMIHGFMKKYWPEAERVMFPEK